MFSIYIYISTFLGTSVKRLRTGKGPPMLHTFVLALYLPKYYFKWQTV